MRFLCFSLGGGGHVGIVDRQKEEKQKEGEEENKSMYEKDNSEKKGKVGTMVTNTISEDIRSGQHG